MSTECFVRPIPWSTARENYVKNAHTAIIGIALSRKCNKNSAAYSLVSALDCYIRDHVFSYERYIDKFIMVSKFSMQSILSIKRRWGIKPFTFTTSLILLRVIIIARRRKSIISTLATVKRKGFVVAFTGMAITSRFEIDNCWRRGRSTGCRSIYCNKQTYEGSLVGLCDR